MLATNDLEREVADLKRIVWQLQSRLADLDDPRQPIFLARDGSSSYQWQELAFEAGALADNANGRACTYDEDASALVPLDSTQFVALAVRDGWNTRYVKITGGRTIIMARITGGNSSSGWSWEKVNWGNLGYETDPNGPTSATAGYGVAREVNGYEVAHYIQFVTELYLDPGPNNTTVASFQSPAVLQAANDGNMVDDCAWLNIPTEYALGGEFVADQPGKVNLKLYGLTIQQEGTTRGTAKGIYTLNIKGATITASGTTATITMTGSETQVVGMTITGFDYFVGGSTSASCTNLILPTGLGIHDNGNGAVDVHLEVYGDGDREALPINQFIRVVNLAADIDYPAGGKELIWDGFWLGSYSSHDATQAIDRRCKRMTVGAEFNVVSSVAGDCAMTLPIVGDGNVGLEDPGYISVYHGIGGTGTNGYKVAFYGFKVNGVRGIRQIDFENAECTYSGDCVTVKIPTAENPPVASDVRGDNEAEASAVDRYITTIPNETFTEVKFLGIWTSFDPSPNSGLRMRWLQWGSEFKLDADGMIPGRWVASLPMVGDDPDGIGGVIVTPIDRNGQPGTGGGYKLTWAGAWANMRGDSDQALSPFRITYFDFGREFNLEQDAATPTRYKITCKVMGDVGSDPVDNRTGAVDVAPIDGEHGWQVRWLGFNTKNNGVPAGSAYNIKTLNIPADSAGVLGFTAQLGNIADLGLKPGTLGKTVWHDGTKWTISYPRLSVFQDESTRSTFDTEAFVFSNATVTHDSVTKKTTVVCGGGSLAVSNGGTYVYDLQGGALKVTTLNIEGNGLESMLRFDRTSVTGKVNLVAAQKIDDDFVTHLEWNPTTKQVIQYKKHITGIGIVGAAVSSVVDTAVPCQT